MLHKPHIGESYCNKCRRWKSEAEFYVRQPTRCKTCCREVARLDRIANRDRRDETNRLWKLNNPEKFEALKKRQSLRRYGLTIEAHTAMLQLQFYRCASCGDKFEPEDKMKCACVDHDHVTGENRELLCNRCNLIAGHCLDDTTRLEKMIAYLKRHGK